MASVSRGLLSSKHDLTVIEVYFLPLALQGFPGGSAGKDSACSVRDLGSVPAVGRSPGEGKGCPLQ